MPGSRDYPTMATEAPTVRPAQSPRGREEEFRAALDRYMAFYAEEQRHYTESVERSGESAGTCLRKRATSRWELSPAKIIDKFRSSPQSYPLGKLLLKRLGWRAAQQSRPDML